MDKLQQFIESVKVNAPIKIVDDKTAGVMAQIIVDNLVAGVENLKRVTGSSAKSIQFLNNKLDSYLAQMKASTPAGKTLAQAMGFKPVPTQTAAKAQAHVPPKQKVATPMPSPSAITLRPANMHVMVKTHPDPSVKQPTGLYKVQELVISGDTVQVKIHGNRGWTLSSKGAIPIFLDFYKDYRTKKTKLQSMFDVIRNAS